jgi:hypothetical protein
VWNTLVYKREGFRASRIGTYYSFCNEIRDLFEHTVDLFYSFLSFVMMFLILLFLKQFFPNVGSSIHSHFLVTFNVFVLRGVCSWVLCVWILAVTEFEIVSEFLMEICDVLLCLMFPFCAVCLVLSCMYECFMFPCMNCWCRNFSYKICRHFVFSQYEMAHACVVFVFFLLTYVALVTSGKTYHKYNFQLRNIIIIFFWPSSSSYPF